MRKDIKKGHPCSQEACDCRGQFCTNSHQWRVSSKNVKLQLYAEEDHISITFIPSGIQQHLSTMFGVTDLFCNNNTFIFTI